MSRQKRGVQLIQQDEPAFLKRMKQQAGYKEGPTVDTKRERLEERDDASSDDDHNDEQPQIVVLKSGDLTAEQVKQAEKEAATKPREATNEKIVFKKPTKKAEADTDKSQKAKRTAKKVKNQSLLSFGDEEEEES